MDKTRFQEMEQRDFYLWGHTAEVTYYFFDHKLYEYLVSIRSGTALLDSQKDIMTALEARAGVAQPDNKRGGLRFSMHINGSQVVNAYSIG